ncbi:hypothetical protein BOTNAR_0020g00480 [Botryotinia narcissicola]|uniref:3'-5' exoribonuclease Rv2179c-like domain-containing protein n=1 Tax=Botryotinia narcissicola TaxID=278944 RepID=A0A4Z1J6B7_9HELO|nr:hypothetical protein BOTNAR_0020g00480 [Botryotinia narcissicola]
MSAKDVRTHIMLDLEIAAHPLKHNPAIIQIGAIHFDIETGEVLKTFSVDINLESCIESGLITDSDTLQWLEKNIPDTLFTTWLSSCHKSNQVSIKTNYPAARFDRTDLQVMVWAYGSTQDCRWMESAYKAADLRKPWMYYNDLCVRTYCEAAFSITGRNIRREVDKTFVGKKHDAIDDCKHQILYLNKCRDALRGLQGSAIAPFPVGPISESSGKRPRTVLDDNRSRMGLD